MEYMITAAAVNTAFCFLTLLLVGIGVTKSRSASSSKLGVEKRLVWQTTVSSILLTIFFVVQVWAVSNYIPNFSLYSTLISISTVIMLFQRYPSVIILFLAR